MDTTIGVKHTWQNKGSKVQVNDGRRVVTVSDVNLESREPIGTPNWNRRKNSGELIVNPYSASRIIAPAHGSVYTSSNCFKPRNPNVLIDFWEEWMLVSRYESYFGIRPDDAPIPDPSFSKEALITKARAKANEAVWDASTSLAEMGETIAMLAALVSAAKNPLRTFTELFARKAKLAGRIRVDKLSIKQIIETGSSGWLQWRYGIRPLIGDIQSAIDAWNTEAELRFRKSVRPSGEDTFIGTVDLRSTQKVSSLPVGTVMGQEMLQSRDGGQCVITSDFVYESTRAFFLDQLGFTARSVPKVAWELVPFSFIVDWFVNVGQWIDTVSNPTGLAQRAGCYSARGSRKSIRRYTRKVWYHTDHNGEWMLTAPPFTVERESAYFSREVISTSDIQTPNFGSGFNVARSFDLGAIFLQISRLLKR